MSTHEIQVDQSEAGQRLDIFVVTKMPDISRAKIQKAITAGTITVDGQTVKPKHVIGAGQHISIAIPEKADVAIEDLPQVDIPIIFEDKDILVINKPAGISVHEGQGARQYTVVDWLLQYIPDVANVGDDTARPGIVHRLDKDTSGALVIAKNQKTFEHLKKEFKNRQVKKEYVALVFGVPGETSGRIVRAMMRSKRNPLRRTIDPAGKEAITEWRKEESFGRFSLLRLYPLTGRMHQLRVHMHFLGFPIVGDKLYTFRRQKSPAGVARHLLHAEKLMVEMKNGKKKVFQAPLPEDFSRILDSLRHHGIPTSA